MLTKNIFEAYPKITAILCAELIPQDASSDEDAKLAAIENLITTNHSSFKTFFAKFKVGIATIQKFYDEGDRYVSFLTSKASFIMQLSEEDSFEKSFSELLAKAIATAEFNLKEVNEKDIFDAANALFISNGKTTSKEVKDYLRAQGFFVNQKFVSTTLASLAQIYDWDSEHDTDGGARFLVYTCSNPVSAPTIVSSSPAGASQTSKISSSHKSLSCINDWLVGDRDYQTSKIYPGVSGYEARKMFKSEFNVSHNEVRIKHSK